MQRLSGRPEYFLKSLAFRIVFHDLSDEVRGEVLVLNPVGAMAHEKGQLLQVKHLEHQASEVLPDLESFTRDHQLNKVGQNGSGDVLSDWKLSVLLESGFSVHSKFRERGPS